LLTINTNDLLKKKKRKKTNISSREFVFSKSAPKAGLPKDLQETLLYKKPLLLCLEVLQFQLLFMASHIKLLQKCAAV
jgi:hypothetical protein